MGVVEVVVPEVEGLERVHEGTIVTVRGGSDEAKVGLSVTSSSMRVATRTEGQSKRGG